MSSRGTPVSDETIEIIKATFAETGNLRAAARAANCSVATAKKYAESRDEFEQVRTEKRLSVIEEITRAQVILIQSMIEPKRLRSATLSELSNTFGTVTDKGLLLSGQATNRTAFMTDDPSTKLTPEEMELAARVREKLAAQ
jgi:hypothetical protein